MDVLEEENIVKQQSREGALDPKIAVQIRGLVKTYPGFRTGCRRFCCCCCARKTPPSRVVKVKNLLHVLVFIRKLKIRRTHCFVVHVEEIL